LVPRRREGLAGQQRHGCQQRHLCRSRDAACQAKLGWDPQPSPPWTAAGEGEAATERQHVTGFRTRQQLAASQRQQVAGSQTRQQLAASQRQQVAAASQISRQQLAASWQQVAAASQWPSRPHQRSRFLSARRRLGLLGFLSRPPLLRRLERHGSHHDGLAAKSPRCRADCLDSGSAVRQVGAWHSDARARR
jgi:hypothetical protein